MSLEKECVLNNFPNLPKVIYKLLDAIGRERNDSKQLGNILITRGEVSDSISNQNNYYTSDFINLLLHAFNQEALTIQIYSAITVDKVQDDFEQIKSSVKDYHFIPLNIAYDEKESQYKNHWAALIIDKKHQLIFYLDPAQKQVIPAQVELLKTELGYKNEIILNPIDFQKKEKQEGLVRHCGAYLVEIFKVFQKCIHQGQSISGSALPNINIDNNSISLQTALSVIPCGEAETAAKIRNNHIQDAYTVLVADLENSSQIQNTQFEFHENLESYSGHIPKEEVCIKNIAEEYANKVREGECLISFIEFIKKNKEYSKIYSDTNVDQILDLKHANLSGDKDYILKGNKYGETDFSKYNFKRSDLSEASCMLAKFEEADLDEVIISGIKDLNPARIYTAKNIETIKPNNDKYAKDIKYRAVDLSYLDKTIREKDPSSYKTLKDLINKYQQLYDTQLCNNKEVNILLETIRSLKELGEIIDKFPDDDKIYNNLPNKDNSKILISSINDLFYHAREYDQSDKCRLQIFALILSYARVIKHDKFEKKSLKQILNFVISKYNIDQNIKISVRDELKAYLDKASSSIQELRHSISLNDDNLEEFLKNKKNLYSGFVKKIFELAHKILGNAPCEFSIIFTGSLATALTTCYSNISFFIISNKIDKISLIYLNDFIFLIEELIIASGNSDPPHFLKSMRLVLEGYYSLGFNIDIYPLHFKMRTMANAEFENYL